MLRSLHNSCTHWTTAFLVPLPATLHLNDTESAHSVFTKPRCDSYSSSGLSDAYYQVQHIVLKTYIIAYNKLLIKNFDFWRMGACAGS